MSKVLSLRVPDGLAEWADEYAEARGVKRADLLVSALESFREDCERGVPEIRERAREQAALSRGDQDERGVGDCPDRPGVLGHIWRMGEDRVNRCRFCGVLGREFLQGASERRAELFAGLRTPRSAHVGTAQAIKEASRGS